MLEIFSENPWLIVCAMGLLIPILGIVFGTVTSYLQQTRQAELEASLKHAMLERGMSAEEIAMVLQASSRNRGCKKLPLPDHRHEHHH
jgi:hypothetical protein